VNSFHLSITSSYELQLYGIRNSVYKLKGVIMNWQQLEYFKTIAETENFTEAANLLSVTQPALSKAMSKLEEELDVPLFEKHGRNIRLTRYGDAFLKHTVTALGAISEGIQELKDMFQPDAGTISISSLYTLGTRLIPEAVSEFLNIYPNIKFEYCMETVDNIKKGLTNGLFDLGLFADLDESSIRREIESIPVKQEELVIIIPKNHPLSNKTEISLLELKDENFVFFSEIIKSKISTFFHSFGLTPKSVLNSSENSMVVIGFVSAGLGISIVPYSCFLKTESISVLRAKELQCYRTIYLGWKKSTDLSPSAKLFKDFLIEFISSSKSNSISETK
jgi:DNA-binding transcriptional LysR family regulator